MKKHLLKTLFLCLFTLAGTTAFAYDCEVDGICYDLNATDRTASVTSGNDKYSGAVHIPEKVVYDGITYSVTSISNDAFYVCTGLTELTIPNSLTTIGRWAFSGCSGLTELTIPSSVTSISVGAFSGCSGLTELTIPNSVTSIGKDAFILCYGLEKIVVEAGNPYYDSRENCNAIIHTDGEKATLVVGCKNTRILNSVTSIGDDAFSGCIGLTVLTIPNSVTSIGDRAFNGCIGLTELTIGNSVTTIGSNAFSDCRGLTELTIGNSVTTIGSDAFSDCRGLTELTIGNSVTTIGKQDFIRCSSLVSVTSLNTTPPAASGYNTTFNETVQQIATLHVPAGCKEAYAQAEWWKDFSNIQEDAVDGIAPVVKEEQPTIDAIYTIDGVKLNATSPQDLPSDIYIVNGKKVSVK